MPYAQDIDIDLVLTTGVIRDLLVTGFCEQILNTLPSVVHFPLQVYEDYRSRNEIHNERNRPDPDQNFLESLTELNKMNLLSLAELESDEEFHEFSIQTSDYRLPKQRFGALVGVLAKHRKWIVACNDRKTMNMLNAFNPKGRYVTGLDLIRTWADLPHVNQSDAHQVFSKLNALKIYQ